MERNEVFSVKSKNIVNVVFFSQVHHLQYLFSAINDSIVVFHLYKESVRESAAFLSNVKYLVFNPHGLLAELIISVMIS